MRTSRLLILAASLLSFGRTALAAEGGGATARAFLGVESGLAVGLESAERTVVVEAAQSFLPAPVLRSLTDLGVTISTPRRGGWLGGRLGYQLAIVSFVSTPERDLSHTGDVGLVLGWTGQRGHTLALEAGVERVYRADAFSCCDSTLRAASTGARVVLAGELELGPRAALFGRVGVRTGDHLVEIHVLPVLELGVAVRF